MLEKQFKVTGTTGFAFEATLLVRIAYMYTSKISLEYQGISVDLKNSVKSIIDVMSVGIRPCSQFNIRVEGSDEHQTLQAIEKYLSGKIFTI